ncbi:GDSL-type esterase/lipase family protein [Nocardiopsis sp. NPDC058631]|uniref:GDSL-type esterase/lipase family protein n=1 Tax=Nocardiopsis sp. NPDC058631 TaxID=3346566 RepID=UPI0036575490
MAAAAAAVLATGCAGGDGAEPSTTQSYYLSLGDSLTVGIQPDGNGTPQETSDGYTDILYRTLYDADSTLQHERMGCGGEDTTSFLGGGIPHCDEQYGGTSQIEAAEDFLSGHEGRVGLVTLTIGGNNFTGCVTGLDGGAGPTVDTACVDDGLERVESEIPEIANRLRTAAGPGTRIVAMTYYNPFLAAQLLGDGAEASEEPGDSDGPAPPEDGPRLGEAEGELPFDAGLVGYATDVLEQLNESLRSGFAAEDIAVADVESAFGSLDGEVPADSATGLPSNLQNVCDLTWMCNTDQGPDIHTNQAGARVIAAAFEELAR